ncbi:MAG: glycosyltransferase family 4 protein [Bacteroidota bacterium]
MLKVAFISRSTLFSSPGGDSTQLEMTAKCLRALGVTVDIYISGQVVNYSEYNLLHFFNIIRPADIITHIDRTDTPFVVSTIFVQYGEYEKKARKGIGGIVSNLLPENTIEYVKVIARRVLNGEKIGSYKYLLWGHKRSIQYIARKAACLLPNSHNEYRRFAAMYNIERPYRFVPNGVDSNIVNKVYTPIATYKGAVICMGRIEGRKNQLSLIRALKNTALRLFIHGKPSPNNMAYFDLCKAEATENIHISEWLQDEELYAVYSSAKVHCLPSYFETTGLSSLEAAVMGCNIVVTDKGDTNEYFEGYAWFCDPDDTASIRKAVEDAHKAPYNQSFREKILSDYTWEKAAAETLIVYKQVLGL